MALYLYSLQGAHSLWRFICRRSPPRQLSGTLDQGDGHPPGSYQWYLYSVRVWYIYSLRVWYIYSVRVWYLYSVRVWYLYCDWMDECM